MFAREEFRATLKYCFFLFQRPFTAALEEATRAQWQKLGAGDVSVQDSQRGGLGAPLRARVDSSV